MFPFALSTVISPSESNAVFDNLCEIWEGCKRISIASFSLKDQISQQFTKGNTLVSDTLTVPLKRSMYERGKDWKAHRLSLIHGLILKGGFPEYFQILLFGVLKVPVIMKQYTVKFRSEGYIFPDSLKAIH